VRARHPASGALLLQSSASLRPVLLQPLPQAVGLDQHILRISKLLLPLVVTPAKVGPVPLFALREPLDQFEVDLGATTAPVMKSLNQPEAHHVVQSTEGTCRTLGLVTIGVIREFVAGPANALLRPTCDALNNSSRSPPI